MTTSAVIPAHLLPVGDGGSPDTEARFTATVRLVSNSGLILGSGVLVNSRWVLTAAHCVRNQPAEILVDRPGSSGSAGVSALIWRSGEHYEYASSDPWPRTVLGMKAGTDGLVLLVLDAELLSPNGFAEPSLASPSKGDLLTIAGFGENEFGNYPSTLWFADLASHCQCTTVARNSAIKHPTSPTAGMPRKDDSGAPVFLPSSSTDAQQLVGIHASRGPENECCPRGMKADGAIEVARYLPVDFSTWEWIESAIAAHESESKQIDALAPAPAARSEFCLRNQFHCWDLSSQDELDANVKTNTTWYLDDVAGKGILEKCDTVDLTTVGATTTMTINRMGKSVYSANLTKGSAHVLSKIQWLNGTDTNNNVTFYVYAMPRIYLTGKTARGVRVEAFKIPGDVRIPSDKNVADNKSCGNTSTVRTKCEVARAALPADAATRLLAALLDQTEDDQDDEGSGHNGPHP